MTTNHKRICKHDVTNQLTARLLRDDSGVTPIEHVAAAVALALAAIAAARPIAGVLTSSLFRIHIIATLLTP